MAMMTRNKSIAERDTPNAAANTPRSTPRLRETKRVHFRDLMRVKLPSNSFGATQRWWQPTSNANETEAGRLDVERSGQEVDCLLQIRRQMMKHARSVGDGAEVYRLQNLRLFDSVYKDTSLKCPAGGVQASHELSADETESDEDSEESPTIKASSTSSVRSPTIYKESPLDHAAFSAVATDSVDEVDVFLEMVKENPGQCRRSGGRILRLHRYSGRCGCPSCKGDEACARYVRGRGCCLPRSHPDIIAAKQRIDYFEQSPVISQLKRDLSLIADSKSEFYRPGSPEIDAVRQTIDTSCQSIVVRQLELDMALVDMYNSEMEVRCANGIWWEGWLVVGELRRRGIVGSVSSLKTTAG
ncbi:MAG: hypothetical protein Q9217_000439 [Psora testacea]